MRPPAKNAGGAEPMSPRYPLVIFDFDGTLADSGDWFVSIADHLAERFKFRKVAPEELEGLRGKTSSEVIRHLGIPRWKLPAIGRYTHALLAQQADRIQLFDGVTALLQQLAARGVRIVLVTSNAEDNVRTILGPDNAALIERFECGASLFGKARRYRKVLRKCDIALHEAISIGDETRDVAAAKKVGICSGAVLWGYANREALVRLKPDLLFDTPEQVLHYLLGEQDTLAA
jgi:phosphoglycolate phosphatase